jgi:hypothetical protein
VSARTGNAPSEAAHKRSSPAVKAFERCMSATYDTRKMPRVLGG